MEIPRGNSREDIKTRKQIINDFYVAWIEEHPDKRVWNKSLRAYIYVKFQSINETKGQASISYESTKAVFELTEILEKATVVKRKPAKNNDKNQRPYDQMVFLYYKGIRLLAGHQKSKDEYVQFVAVRYQKQPVATRPAVFHFVEHRGFEPLTYRLRTYRSTN